MQFSSRGRRSRTQFQYTLQGKSLQELQTWAPKVVEGLKGIGGAGLSSAGKAGYVLSGSNNAIGSLYSKIGEAKASQGIAQGNLLGGLFGKALSFGMDGGFSGLFSSGSGGSYGAGTSGFY